MVTMREPAAAPRGKDSFPALSRFPGARVLRCGRSARGSNEPAGGAACPMATGDHGRSQHAQRCGESPPVQLET